MTEQYQPIASLLERVRVIELHGNAHGVQCLGCEAWYARPTIHERVLAGELEPACVACGGILKFPCVEPCSAEVEPHIRIIRFQRNQFFVGGQLARAEPDERVRGV